MFIDRATIKIRAGRGGNGVVSFFRARRISRGGPDGGNGGKGGSVYLRADPQMTTLFDFESKPLFAAVDGTSGRRGNQTGASGKDLYIDLPCGTQVWHHPRREPMAHDLVEPGQTVLVARGGKGGRGNKSYAGPTNQAPRECEEGEAGEAARLDLELKLIADVGLVGLPNAGKSTLLRSLSRARPRVAAYPFTTLHPHLGLCEVDEDRRLVFADIPGLIEGAHEGAGLGHEFLRHVERTRVLAHLVSSETSDITTLLDAYRTIEEELCSHSEALAAKDRVVILTKLDLYPEEEGKELTRTLAKALGKEVCGISGVSGLGVRTLIELLDRRVREEKE